MATIQRYVNTASSGGDGTTNATSGASAAYASLSAWESGMGAGNAADDYIVDCCGTAADATAVTVNFDCNSLIIRANAGEPDGKYNGTELISTSHYRLRVTAASNCLYASTKNTTIDGLQVIQAAAGGPTLSAIEPQACYGTTVVKNCRIHSENGSTGYGIGSAGTAAGGADGRTWTYENNLIVNFAVAGIRHTGADFWDSTVTIQNNTIYNSAQGNGIIIRGGTSSANSDVTFGTYANAIGNTGANVGILPENISSGAPGGATYADNACSVASSTTDEIVLGTASDAWTSPGTTAASDFTVKNASSALYNAVNPTRATTDITTFTRDGTNHDVGAFELQTASQSQAPRSMHHFQQMRG